MRILYSGYIKDLSTSSGVVKKMLSLEKASNRLNIDLNVIFFTSSNIPYSLKSKSIFISRNSPLWHYKFLSQLKEYAHRRRYTHLILRHSGFSPFYPMVFKNKNFVLISEHNTKELTEYLSNRNILFYISELFSQNRSFKYIDAVISVTDEIAEYEQKRIKEKKIKIISLTNGIDYQSIPFTPPKAFDGKNIDLLYIGSRAYPWNSLDRFFKGLIKTEYRINLHLVGDNDNFRTTKNIQETINIINHGKITGKNLDGIFMNSNLAISSLSIHKNKMKQACPLKSREYCARGMPFIYSYNDPDLDGFEGIKKFSIDDQKIDIYEVIDFLTKINNENFNQICKNLRFLARNKIDISEKITKLIDFMDKL